MEDFRSALYVGHVVHARLRPARHKFRYRVFALALDVDEIDTISHAIPLFSRNRMNALSFHDSDVGAPGNEPVAVKIRRLLTDVGLAEFGHRVTLVTYPRLWGYVFNPLSVYFCNDAAGRPGATVYEVTNTFRERHAYVLRTSEPQACRKSLYVSPFTDTPADYAFHTTNPGERLVVGVTLRDSNGPVLRTHFSAARDPLSTLSVAAVVASHPLMTLKVIGAIHLEAARLWGKGVPVVPRHTSPSYSYRLIDNSSRTRAHAS
ncbi:MAG: DUF1365 domain-containing protein [Hyphomicrobiaceae bacterium]